MNQPPQDEQDFASVPLRQFASIGIGLVIKMPVSWEQAGTERVFQLKDTASDLEFAASAYENPGIDLAKWAELRLRGVAEKMPGLRPIRAPYPLSGVGWEGYVGEYEGTFPGGTTVKHYLVLALLARKLPGAGPARAQHGRLGVSYGEHGGVRIACEARSLAAAEPAGFLRGPPGLTRGAATVQGKRVRVNYGLTACP